MKKSNCLYRNKKYVLMLLCLKDVLFPIGIKKYVLMLLCLKDVLFPIGIKKYVLMFLCLKDVIVPIGIKNMFLCSSVKKIKICSICINTK